MPDQRQKNSSGKKGQAVNLDTIGLEMGNKPPQALDVEEAVLGAMMVDPFCVDAAMSELDAGSFYDKRHMMIFEAIQSLVNEHSPVDIVTVSSRLKAKGDLEAVGGAVVLTELSRKVGAASNMEFYVKILRQKSIQRDLIQVAHKMLQGAYDEGANVDDLVDSATGEVYGIAEKSMKKEVQQIGNVVNDALLKLQDMQGQTGLSGVPSGFVSLDTVTMGWQPSDLIILAARPSVGKTAFSLNLARNAAVEHHRGVAFFSLEMSAIQLARRLMTAESGLSADKIKGGQKLEAYEWEQLELKLKNLIASPLYIDDTPSLPVSEFRTKVKNLVKTKGVELVIVDYLQLMQGPSDLRGMREQEVAAISRTLKATAKELNVPIIALSQLSRNAVQRTGGSGRPQLSDLRESGSIEQDADMVLFIHRPDYLGMSDDPADKNRAQVIIAKHRNGQTCDIEMIFKSEQVRFVENDNSLISQTIGSAMNDDVNFESGAGAGDFYGASPFE